MLRASWLATLRAFGLAAVLLVLAPQAPGIARAAEMAPVGQFLPQETWTMRVGAFALPLAPPRDQYRTRLGWLLAVNQERPIRDPLYLRFYRMTIGNEWAGLDRLPIEGKRDFLLAFYVDLATLEVGLMRASGWDYLAAVGLAVLDTTVSDLFTDQLTELAKGEARKTAETTAAALARAKTAKAPAEKLAETAAQVVAPVATSVGYDIAVAEVENLTRHEADLSTISDLLAGNAKNYTLARATALATYLTLSCGCPLPQPKYRSHADDAGLTLTLGTATHKYITRLGRILAAAPSGETSLLSDLMNLDKTGISAPFRAGELQRQLQNELAYYQGLPDDAAYGYLAGLAYDLENVQREWGDRRLAAVESAFFGAAVDGALGIGMSIYKSAAVIPWTISTGASVAYSVKQIGDSERATMIVTTLRHQVAAAMQRKSSAGCACMRQPVAASALHVADTVHKTWSGVWSCQRRSTARDGVKTFAVKAKIDSFFETKEALSAYFSAEPPASGLTPDRPGRIFSPLVVKVAEPALGSFANRDGSGEERAPPDTVDTAKMAGEGRLSFQRRFASRPGYEENLDCARTGDR